MRLRRGAVPADLLVEPLTVVDVGCRWGFAREWEALGVRGRLIGFDPDPAECVNLRVQYAGRPYVRIVPLALGRSPGRATIHVTDLPAESSLYPPGADCVRKFGRPVVVSSVEVDIATLDDWCRGEGVERIDVLKLDIQGAELDVLMGATRMLASIRAIRVEVEFNPIYEGAPLFGDVDRFLRQHDFVLWRLKDLVHWWLDGRSYARQPTDTVYGNGSAILPTSAPGQLYFCDAYYVRRDLVFPSAAAGWEQLVADACVTAGLGFDDLSELALEQARPLAPPEQVGDVDDLLAGFRSALARPRG